MPEGSGGGLRPEEREGRFRLVEKGKKGAKEEIVTPVGESLELSLDQIAEEWGKLQKRSLETDRRGAAREPEARFQNLVARGVLTGRFDLGPQFRDRLESALGKAAASRGIPKAEVRGLYEGIETVVRHARILERQFEEEYDGTGMRQMLGTNDRLDATKEIDLIEIVYDSTKPDIDRVRFIQSKTKGLSLTEVSRIQDEHARYLEELMGSGEFLAETRKKEADAAVRTGRFLKEMKEGEASGDRAARVGALVEYFSPLFLGMYDDLPSSAKEVDDERVRRWIGGENPEVPMGIVKLYFRHDQAKALLRHGYATLEAEIPEKELAAAIRAVQGWAAASELSAQEIAEIDPDFQPDPNLLRTTRFESVVMHGSGNAADAREITLGEAKVLTIH